MDRVERTPSSAAFDLDFVRSVRCPKCMDRPWKSGASAPRKPWREERGFSCRLANRYPSRIRPWNPTLDTERQGRGTRQKAQPCRRRAKRERSRRKLRLGTCPAGQDSTDKATDLLLPRQPNHRRGSDRGLLGECACPLALALLLPFVLSMRCGLTAEQCRCDAPCGADTLVRCL
jgi:hypothetical protein